MSVVELLAQARELITEPGAWVQGAFARDEKGYAVDSTSPAACAWCTVGALRAVTMAGLPASDEDNKVYHARSAIAARGVAVKDMRPAVAWLREAAGLGAVAGGSGGVSDWNDAPSTTHDQVLDVFDRAIAKAGRS